MLASYIRELNENENDYHFAPTPSIYRPSSIFTLIDISISYTFSTLLALFDIARTFIHTMNCSAYAVYAAWLIQESPE
jgi:hypothetical protein